MAKDDGEDSAGRQKLRPLTEWEIVQKAFNISEETFKEAKLRGWIETVPDLNEINAESDVAKDKERQRKAERELA